VIASAFGACSPKTTCRKEMSASATVEATPARSRQPAAKYLGDSLLGDVPQEDRSYRDSELSSGKLAVKILLCCLDRLSLSVPLTDQRLDASATCGNERELSGDEEGVRDHKDQDRQQPPDERVAL
jgi:hypothetical protein